MLTAKEFENMFLPRSLTAKRKGPAQPSGSATHSEAPVPTDSRPLPQSVALGKGNRPKTQDEYELKELATLAELSLSNHALWSNPGLRKLVETRPDGWLSLTALFRHSALLASCDPTEPRVAQALRSNGALEVQLSLSNNRREISGLYNIRRRDWQSLKDLNLREWSEDDWDQRTVYIENIPPPYRKTLTLLEEFLETVFDLSASSSSVQAIEFPPREGSTENDLKCRGFAFLVCSNTDDVQSATKLWSWDGIETRFHEHATTTSGAENRDEGDEMRNLAMKCGFRALGKARWCALRDEYIEYHKAIVGSNAAAEASAPGRLAPPALYPPAEPALPQEEEGPSLPLYTASSPPKSYPQGCLVFVRNIHPETNKTTIKSMLSRAFKGGGQEVDYVDYNKGMDSAHIRVCTPDQAGQLDTFFRSHLVIQRSGLDDSGGTSARPSDHPTDGSPIETEVVSGKREELYWEKVPEKIRHAALEKAIGEGTHGEEDNGLETNVAKKRKRQRKA